MAYVNATNLFGSGVSGLQSAILGEIDDYLPDGATDPTVIAGYKAIYNTTANVILTSPIGVIEMLIGNDLNEQIRIGPALQHPFSHGRVYITTSNPMDFPLIDPAYLKHPAGTLFRAGCGPLPSS